MKRILNNFKIILFAIPFIFTATHVWAQDDESAIAQANNPLANMKALNFQDYYIGDMSNSDEDANQFWIRYAQPLTFFDTKWLMRASMPVNSFPTPPDGDKDTGFGDFNVFASYLFDTGNPAVSFGFGPQITMPTASEEELGSEKWSGGFANVLFNASSRMIQYGYLLTWQHSFAGDSDRDDVNAGALQPFAMLQLGKGTYLRSTPIWVYNFESNDYSIPLGIGIGQVIKKDKTVFNVFVEPQWSLKDEGAGQPKWQIFFGLNMQFLQ